jgi:hypothetical protein
MDILAQGAQYTVIDQHDGSVRKMLSTPAETQAVLESWYAPNAVPPEESAIDYRQLALESCSRVQKLLENYPELQASFGNPRFGDNGNYIQNKVATIGQVLARASVVEAEELIAEQVFNCTVNNGLDNAGQVILLDFGEITPEKENVRAHINSQRWLRAISYTRDMPEQVQAYYRNAMASRLTVFRLDTTWQTAIKE